MSTAASTPPSTPADRLAAMFAHLSAIIAAIVSAGWLSFVGPLVVWFLYRDSSRFVRKSAAASFNFNIGIWLMSIIGWVMIFTVVLSVVGIVLLAVAGIATIWCHLRATVLANRGELYNYPFQLRLLN